MNDYFIPVPKIKIKKHKRETVTDKTYNAVFERDKGRCRICGTSYNLELHHIVYRSEAKDKINDIGNCIMLCNEHHRLVHSNKKYWKPKLLEILGG